MAAKRIEWFVSIRQRNRIVARVASPGKWTVGMHVSLRARACLGPRLGLNETMAEAVCGDDARARGRLEGETSVLTGVPRGQWICWPFPMLAKTTRATRQRADARVFLFGARPILLVSDSFPPSRRRVPVCRFSCLSIIIVVVVVGVSIQLRLFLSFFLACSSIFFYIYRFSTEAANKRYQACCSAIFIACLAHA